jgi:hypothetical protein
VTASKEPTTKASSNSEALFFVLPLRVSAGRVVRQRQRDRLEKKKNAITRLLSQVVVRLAERLRNAQHFGKEQNRERGFCRGNRTVRVALAGRAYRYSWGKRKMGIPGFCHITLQGGCAASSHRRFGKEVQTAHEAFVAKSCRPVRFPNVRDLEKKKNRVPGFCANILSRSRESRAIKVERGLRSRKEPSHRWAGNPLGIVGAIR